MFDIYASLPVVESFGFAKDLRTETAGNVVPQLVFSHWEMIKEDPLWIPTTNEEIEDYGQTCDIEIYCRTLIDKVRERKGLKLEKQVVIHGEKQSTLSKKR